MSYSSFNKIMILGRLGRDPELRYSTSGNPITKFTVATSERTKSANGQMEEQTEWHRIVVFGTQAENCSKFLKKGSLVFIEGRVQTRKYTDKENNEKSVTEVIASTIHFLDSRDASGDAPSAPASSFSPRNNSTGNNSGGDRTYQKSPSREREEAFNSALSDAVKGAPDDDDLPF